MVAKGQLDKSCSKNQRYPNANWIGYVFIYKSFFWNYTIEIFVLLVKRKAKKQ